MTYFLNTLYQIALVLITIEGLFFWNRKIVISRFVTLICLSTSLVEMITYYLSNHKGNVQLYHHIFTPVEGTLFIGLSMHLLGVYKAKYLWYIAFVWSAIAIGNAIWLQPVTSFNANTILLETFVCSVVSCFILYKTVLISNGHYLRNATFWISSSFLLFNSITFVYLGLLQIIYRQHQSLFNVLNIIHLIVNLLFYLGLGYAILLIQNKSRNNGS